MSKTEILRQSAQASNETRLERLAIQIETVKQAKMQSVEDLAMVLEPLAQAMAKLTDETRQTLMDIEKKSREQAESFKNQMTEATRNYQGATEAAKQAASGLNEASQGVGMANYLMAILTGVLTALLVSAFWLWYAPPSVENKLDAKAVADHLKPALTEAIKPTRRK